MEKKKNIEVKFINVYTLDTMVTLEDYLHLKSTNSSRKSGLPCPPSPMMLIQHSRRMFL